jgi:heptosyltransferase-3
MARAKIVAVAEDMGNTAYFLALISGASKRIGTRPPYLKIPFAITHPVALNPGTAEAEKSWQLGSALVEAAGGDPWLDTPPAPDLSHLAGTPAESFDILIHAGASREYKRWPLSRYQELAVRLAQDHRVGWIEVPEAPAPANVETIQTRNLDELVSHLAKASLFIGNNSGPMNLASAMGVPSLIFIGPSPRSWDPYWHRNRIRILRDETLPCIECGARGMPPPDNCTNLTSPFACMNCWSVETVMREAREWLQRWTSPAR